MQAPASLLYFFPVLWWAESLISHDRTQMNIQRNPAQVGRRKAPGVIARVLRTPGTLAFPGLAR